MANRTRFYTNNKTERNCAGLDCLDRYYCARYNHQENLTQGSVSLFTCPGKKDRECPYKAAKEKV